MEKTDVAQCPVDVTVRLYEEAQDNPDSLEWKAAAEIERLRELVGILAVPVGWKLVPIRATEEMLDAAEKAEADLNSADAGVWLGLQSYYRAMVNAAPTMPPTANVTGGSAKE